MKIFVGLYLHDCSFDLVSSVVHVERELCPDPARVLNQTDSGAMSGHVQGVHDLQHRRRSGTFIGHRCSSSISSLIMISLLCFVFATVECLSFTVDEVCM